MSTSILTRNLLFIATGIAMTVYLLWRALFTLPLEYGLPSFLAGLLLLICETVAGLEALEQYLNMARAKRLELPVIPPDWYPEVDIFVITHNESVDLLFETVNAATYLDYPDKSKVHVYLCDDTNRPEMRELAERLGAVYLGMAENKHAKAGNFNNALFQTSSPLVATFDADMIPHRDFLMRTVPYFFLPRLKKDADGRWQPRAESEIDRNQKIGFIQSPQSFYNPDLFQFNLYAETRLPNEQDYFFREINVGRNRTNTAIFAGSNAVISRQALLDVGGMALGTITEDFETGMRIQREGYTTYAIKEILAHGLAPHTIGSLMAQRERWARGCIQSLRHVRPFLRPGFSLAAKVSLLFTLVYWWTFFRRFVYIIVPILSVVFDLHIVVCTLWQILLFWLPYYFLSNKTLNILSGNIRTQHWSNLIDTIMFPYLIGPMFMESLGIKKKKFVVTKKKKQGERTTNTIAPVLPHLFLLLASAVALFICLRQSLEYRTVYNAIIIFWLIVNGKNLALAVFFMLGRSNDRQADRFKAELPVEIKYRGYTYAGLTIDIAESGLTVNMTYPVYLPDDESFVVRIDGGVYQAEMKCAVVHVDPQRDHSWRYSFKVVKLDETNRRQWAQIVYDRPHSLPVVISETMTVLDDFHDNLDKRLRRKRTQAVRRLPRLALELSVSTPDGQALTIEDFNYKYVWLRSDRDLPAKMEVEAAPGVWFRLQLAAKQKHHDKKGALYLVSNWKELLDDPGFHQLMRKWVQAQSYDAPLPDTAVVKVSPTAVQMPLYDTKLKHAE